jgi:hypothetical protein
MGASAAIHARDEQVAMGSGFHDEAKGIASRNDPTRCESGDLVSTPDIGEQIPAAFDANVDADVAQVAWHRLPDR